MFDNQGKIENEHKGWNTEVLRAMKKSDNAPSPDMNTAAAILADEDVVDLLIMKIENVQEKETGAPAGASPLGVRFSMELDDLFHGGRPEGASALAGARAPAKCGGVVMFPDSRPTRTPRRPRGSDAPMVPRLAAGRGAGAALRLRDSDAAGAEDALAFKSPNAEQERSTSILRNFPGLVCEIDLDGTTMFVNPAVERLTGYGKRELIGKNWWRRFHPGEEHYQASRLFNAFTEDRVEDHETRLTCKNGEKRDIVWNIVAERDASGAIAKITGVGSDVTGARRAEKELRRLRGHLSNIIDSMPSVFIGVDPDGRVAQWNREAERIAGVSAGDALGRPLEEVFPPLAPEMERVHEAMRTREARPAFRRTRKEDGEIRCEDVSIYPLIANGAENAEGAVIRVDDVTAQVRIEEMMVQSEKMLSVGGLAAGMAHEINNPLAAMMQNACVINSRLTKPRLPANRRAAEAAGVSMESVIAFMEDRGIIGMLDNIREAGGRAADIVTNMLSFARKSDSVLSTHDMDKLLDQTAELAGSDYDLKKKYDFRQIEIVREYEDGLPFVPCESGKIQQVLLNILCNGAQAMREADIEEPRFIFRTRLENDREMVRVEIEDNGPGMDEATRKRVFEPFFTTKSMGVGTGLGLSVSYFIITENHGGEMTVESRPGRGAKFIIRLPMERKAS